MNEPKDKKNPDHSIDPHAHTEHAMQAVDPDDDIPDDQRVTLHRIDPSGVDTRAKTLHAHDPDVQNEPPPIVRSLLPPAPPSMDIKAQYQVDGELSIVNHPAAYITTERGTTDTPAIPFFGDYSINRFRQKHAKEELPPNTTIYTIGSDARCDIHLPKADYPLVKPFHAYVKIQDGKVWILRDQGLVKISKKPGLAMEWRQIEPGEDIIEIIQRPDQKEGRTIESAFVQVIPDHQTLEENDRQNMKDTLRARVTKLTERLNQATEEFKTLIENGNPPADKLEQLSDEANDIAILINDLTKLETDHELVMDSTAIIARTKHLMHVTTELGDMLEAMVTISEGYKAIEKQKEDDKNAREVELRLGAAKWQVDVLHALPNEAPLLSRGDIQKIIDGGLPEKREVHHVFRCPVFTLKKNGEMTSEPMPMLIPSMDIGTHMVCHIELEP